MDNLGNRPQLYVHSSQCKHPTASHCRLLASCQLGAGHLLFPEEWWGVVCQYREHRDGTVFPFVPQNSFVFVVLSHKTQGPKAAAQSCWFLNRASYRRPGMVQNTLTMISNLGDGLHLFALNFSAAGAYLPSPTEVAFLIPHTKPLAPCHVFSLYG